MSSENVPETETDANEEVEATENAKEKEVVAEMKSEGLPDDPEVLRREIAKLRKENAAKRTKNKEIEEAAKKWQEHLDSQKSEMEKLQDQLNALTAENKKLALAQKQRDLAKEYGVDPDLEEFIVGDDLDEMTEKAKKLAAKSKKKPPDATDMRAGRASPPPQSTTNWLKELMK